MPATTANHLFTLPIPALYPSDTTTAPARTFTCTTHPSNPLIYILTFTSPPDNRLTTPFLRTFLHALRILSLRHPSGLLITTSSIPKFYSNGLDLDHVAATPEYRTTLHSVLLALLSFPMPTLALLNGHAFAGGALLALHHDYRVMNPSKGYFCLNEIDFGMLIGTPLLSIARQKLKPQTFRTLVLEGRRYSGPAAVEDGLVDAVGGMEEAVAYAGREKGRELWTKGKSGIYAKMREEMYRVSVEAMRDTTATDVWREGLEGDKARERRVAESMVSQWEKTEKDVKAKL